MAVFPFAIAFASLGCTAQVEKEQSATDAEAIETHSRTINIDFCDWAHHPNNSVCYERTLPLAYGPPQPIDQPCDIAPSGQVSIKNRDRAAFYEIAPNPSSNGAPMTYSDGNHEYDGHAACAIIATGARTLFAVDFSSAPNRVLLNLYGTYDNIKTDCVRVTANYRVDDYEAKGGEVVIAVQVQNSAGQWIDRATKASGWRQDGAQSFDAQLDPKTPFRVQLRTANNPKVTAVRLTDFHVVVPECVPDESNRGRCL